MGLVSREYGKTRRMARNPNLARQLLKTIPAHLPGEAMKLRTNLNFWSTSLLVAASVSPLSGCGGDASAADGTGGTNTGGSNTGGSSIGGSDTGGSGGTGASGSGGTSSGGSGGTSTGGCGGAADLTCKDPQPHVSSETGFVDCSGGFIHRPEVGVCAAGGDCTTDADCATGEICLCQPAGGNCIPSTCETDADCGDNLLCSSYTEGCGSIAFGCQAPEDECAADADCEAWELCSLGADRRICVPQCPVGRPFLIDGEERLASVEARADWLTDIECANPVRTNPERARTKGGHTKGGHHEPLAPQLQQRLAAEWTRIGLMEHASVAAFARFALQLMSLGAPAELLEATQAAMADETKHAKLAFGLASKYSGQKLGPGKLSIERALDEAGLVSIALNTLREGCVGETVAAIEAAEAKTYAEDEAVCAVLSTISADETRHAELSWRFLRWAMDQGEAELSEAVRREIASIETELTGARLRAPTFDVLTQHDEALLQHGVVPEALRNLIRKRVLSEVVVPGLKALLCQKAIRSAGDNGRTSVAREKVVGREASVPAA